MSELARPAPAARLALVQEQFEAVLKKPLRLLPPAVRGPALRVWASHRHLAGLDSALPLAALLSVWIDEHGLHPDDAAAVLDRMLSPEHVQHHKFASDLTTALAREVAGAIRQRRQREEQERVRREAAEAESSAAPAAEVRKLLDGIGTAPRPKPAVSIRECDT